MNHDRRKTVYTGLEYIRAAGGGGGGGHSDARANGMRAADRLTTAALGRAAERAARELYRE